MQINGFMETKGKSKITIAFDGNTETTVWSGKCTEERLQLRFEDAIKAQIVEHQKNPRNCLLRAYNEVGQIVGHETFHGSD